MLKKNDILRIALEQSAYDCSCNAGDFTLNKHVIIGTPVSDSRKRCKKNTNGLLVSYGSNIVASVPDNCVEAVQEYINMFPMEYCFETPGLYLLNEKLEKMNLNIFFQIRTNCFRVPVPIKQIYFVKKNLIIAMAVGSGRMLSVKKINLSISYVLAHTMVSPL